MKTKIKLMAVLKIWAVIYPSVTLFYYLAGQHLTTLPLYQRTFLLTILLVPWMVFAGLPFIEMLFKWIAVKNAGRQNKIH